MRDRGPTPWVSLGSETWGSGPDCYWQSKVRILRCLQGTPDPILCLTGLSGIFGGCGGRKKIKAQRRMSPRITKTPLDWKWKWKWRKWKRRWTILVGRFTDRIKRRQTEFHSFTRHRLCQVFISGWSSLYRRAVSRPGEMFSGLWKQWNKAGYTTISVANVGQGRIDGS